MRSISTLLLLASCYLPLAARGEDKASSSHTVELELDGYMMSCWKPAVFVYENQGWRMARRQLPPKGNYFLDDAFVGYGWCDNLVCNPIGKTILVNLVEYEKVGERPLPKKYKEESTPGRKYPAFKTVPLKGKIKIEVSYFKDKDCKERATFTKILTKGLH